MRGCELHWANHTTKLLYNWTNLANASAPWHLTYNDWNHNTTYDFYFNWSRGLPADITVAGKTCPRGFLGCLVMQDWETPPHITNAMNESGTDLAVGLTSSDNETVVDITSTFGDLGIVLYCRPGMVKPIVSGWGIGSDRVVGFSVYHQCGCPNMTCPAPEW
jgi:hypothetical protein